MDFFSLPHMSSQTSWSPPPPSRLWLKYNRLLKLGRPVGAVTLSRWEWWWNERWIWGARGALNLIFTNYPDHGHHGRLPLSRKNAHGRAGNRTRDLVVSSQELWPPSHEAGPWTGMFKLRICTLNLNFIIIFLLDYCFLKTSQNSRITKIEYISSIMAYNTNILRKKNVITMLSVLPNCVIIIAKS